MTILCLYFNAFDMKIQRLCAKALFSNFAGGMLTHKQ